MEEAVSKRRKGFAATRRNDEDRLAYISASRRASSVLSMSVYSLLRSIAGFLSSSSSSPNCSSPRESASVYAAYLRFHFSVSQPKALRSRAIGYLSELRRVTCLEKSYSFFCSPFSPAEFLAAASNLSSSTATGPDKVAYPMLSDGIQNFKNRFSFVSNSLTTGSLILENHLLRSSKFYHKKQERVR